MKKIYSLLLVALTTTITVAQHRADKWYFGLNAGIDFTSGSPVILTDGALNAIEGVSSICDSAGNLLFYTDGINVWNSLHQVMPNGSNLLGGISVQGALVVPDPGNNDQYYVFTLDAVSGTNGFRYSIVDMTLDTGRGDVTTKDVFIRGNLTERMTAISDAQNDGYWIAVHAFGTDSFFTYHLTPAGFDTNAVVSETGLRHNDSLIQNAFGQMKFSPCGNRLGISVGYLDTVEVFDFDDATGILSNPVSIPMPDHVFGMEFSPDGNKIYVSTYASATLYQIDLTSGIPATIIASRLALGISTDTYGLQLAPDGKVYVVKSFSPWLGAITDPDIAGPSCHYVDTALNVDNAGLGHSPGLCLPGFVQSFFRTASCINTGLVESENNRTQIFPNPFSSQFTINITGDKNMLYVYSIEGKLQLKEEFSNSITTGNSLSPGIYLVKIVSDNSERNYKMIKQ